MTIDIDLTQTAEPTATINQPLTWKTLPYDAEHAKLTLTILGIFYTIWTLLYFVGCYHHWIPSYYAKKMNDYDKLIFRFRVVNCYHGASAVGLSLYWYLTDYSTQYGRRNSTLELIALSNTMAYLTMDGVFMQYEKFLDMGNFLHHLIGVLIYGSIAYGGFDFTFFALHLLPGEISNVAMHLREIIKRCGMRYTKLYYLNDYMYYCEYLACRTVWIPSIYYYIYTAPTMGPVAIYVFPFHCIMSWYYCSNIPPLMIQRWKEYKKIQNNGIKMGWFDSANTEELNKIGIKQYERYHM